MTSELIKRPSDDLDAGDFSITNQRRYVVARTVDFLISDSIYHCISAPRSVMCRFKEHESQLNHTSTRRSLLLKGVEPSGAISQTPFRFGSLQSVPTDLMIQV